MESLRALGSAQTIKTYVRHGIPEDRTYGVSNADLKKIEKTIKGQQDLAYALYDTGIMDAMYLAGLVARGNLMSRDQLNSWSDQAAGMQMISEYPVPWVTVESKFARDAALEWIRSDKEHVAIAGWRTYGGLITIKPDHELNLGEVEHLLEEVVKRVHVAENGVRANMNSFVITVGSYVLPLLPQAKSAAERMGTVSVDVGDTACKVRIASEAIAKMEESGRIGQKRKTIRC